ncbi:PPE family protein [Mycobacterium rhizamassiliense]|uniref:PPE family protein n=1 Tax=Mycobacterium rhizamassiliense TaxID=1841860 RepID=A0A2U3NP49_9MYCO|nr:PPE family protein [Mycobacterium rhizamassiliense]SPM33286.1 PPE family protein [Mycobacterium rhizamassiliense]
MTAPVWMALPPEVHSALLSSGPGPGALMSSAASWSSLSTTYASAAEELSEILAAVQAGAWEGPSAESYVAAHVPYLAWLVQASADSAGEAAAQETAATAYTAALAAMPTLPELATNHVVHGTLLATNFFGINTIPIAVNEADYSRMWVQAATTMTTYQAVSTAAVTAAPQTTAAPQIVKTDGPVQTGPGQTGASYGGGGNSDQGILPIVDNDAGDPWNLSWWFNRFLEPFQTLFRDIGLLGHEPLQDVLLQFEEDIAGVFADEFGHAIQALQSFVPQLVTMAVALPAGLAGTGGLVSLAALVGNQPTVPPVAPLPHTPGLPATAATSSSSLGAAGAAPASSPVPSSVPATTSTAAPAPAAPTPPPTVAPATFPYLVGPPTIGDNIGASAGAQRKAPEPDSAAVAAAAGAAAREAQRARRRRRAAMNEGQRGYRYEFVDADPAADEDPEAELVGSARPSDRGAGSLGFAGTVRRDAAEAAGLATLTGDEFGGGPKLPMVPGSWEPDDHELPDH